VDTEMVADRDDKKISPEKLVKELIRGLEKNQYTIRVGDTKLINVLNRLFPKLTFRLINPKKSDSALKS
ncbi:MAG: short-chain dehydrogenase, partial [Pedobacter sp.]